MTIPAKSTFDLTALLIREWLPLDADPVEASADAKLIALALLAIAEQLKEARSDQKGGKR